MAEEFAFTYEVILFTGYASILIIKGWNVQLLKFPSLILGHFWLVRGINVFEIYGLKQLIREPTRVTAKSQSLIELYLTYAVPMLCPAIRLPALVYLIRKTYYSNPSSVRIITIGILKNFKTVEFLNKDVCQRPWDNIGQFSDPNDMWDFWENQLLACIYRQQRT